MRCPEELTLCLLADGELEDALAQEALDHVEHCSSCAELVAGLRGESRMLVQCLQDIDGMDSSSELFAVPSVPAQPVSLGRLGLGLLGIAAAFRLSSAILFGLEVPASLEWLDPRGWTFDFGVLSSALLFLVDNGRLLITGTLELAVVVALAALAVGAGARLIRRAPAVSAVFAVMLAVGVCAPSGYAIDVRRGAASSLAADEVVNDSMIAIPGTGSGAGADITIAGTVKGDLLAFGNTIRITGTVEGDVVSAGRRVEILGTVGGSVVAAGQTVIVSGSVGRNIAGFASTITLEKTARVGGNGLMFGGETVIDGAIVQDLYGFAGVLDVRGDVAKDVVFRGGQLTIPASGHVGRDVDAHVNNEKQVRIDAAASIGGSKKIELQPNQPSSYSTPRYYFWQAVRLIAAFITGLLLFYLAPWLAPRQLVSGVDWLKAGGIGFVGLVTIPVAALIVGITVIGLPIALGAVVLWIAGLYLAKILVAEFIGRSVVGSGGAVSLFAGLLIVLVVVNLPVLGGILDFLLCIIGLGAIAMMLYAQARRGSVRVSLA